MRAHQANPTATGASSIVTLTLAIVTLTLAIASAVATQSSPYARPLQLLNEAPGARCMDGSPGGLYLHKSKSGSKNFVITLEGGGECVTQERCTEKAATNLGSSRFFPKNFTFFMDSKTHFIDASCTGNPVLCDWNLVYLPYCSQDLWAGQRNISTADTFGFYFSGHRIFEAALDYLDQTASMRGAENIVLTGNSAGGFGVYNNVDALADRYPNTRVVGAPIAGYEFYAWPYTGPGHTSSSLADFRHEAMAGGAYNRLWDALVPAACAAARATEPGSCLLPAFSYTYIKSALFIIEAQSDKVVLQGHDWVPSKPAKPSAPVLKYFKAFKANQSAALSTAMSSASKDGVFNPACYIHTAFTNNITIQGLNYKQAFLAWFKGTATKLADDCGVLCNPTCN